MSPLLGLDEQPEHAVSAVLALGANLGDRGGALQAAVADLAGFEGLRVRAVSSVVETAPVGGPEQPDYLNAVALIDTTLSPLELLAACQEVEDEHGRVRTVRWGARTLDLDLLTYDDLVAVSHHLHLPHPHLAERAFVLVPWLDVDPDATVPGPDGAVRVVDLLARLPGHQEVRPRPDIRLEVPR